MLIHPSEMFTELHREEKREERDRGDQEEKRVNEKERVKLSFKRHSVFLCFYLPFLHFFHQHEKNLPCLDVGQGKG